MIFTIQATRILSSVTALVTWFKSLYFLQLHNQIYPLVFIIFKVFKDIMPFMKIMIIIILPPIT